MGVYYEAHQNYKQSHTQGERRKGRLRGMSNLLPVGVQDLLHSGKPKLRKQEIAISQEIKFLKK
jgi:hypothetical protein